jgi:quercetin dioxygenase-like cupin family protein
MYFPEPSTRAAKDLQPGVKARTFWGEQMLIAVVDLEANALLPSHTHPHEQAGVVLEGEVEFIIAGESKLIHPGDLYIVPGGVEHRVKVGPAPARLLDIFSPVREEFKY